MLKIGLLGVGHLGKIHLKCLFQTDFEIVGFFDPSDAAAQFMADSHPTISRFMDVDTLLNAVDAVDIVSPTIMHFELASKAIAAGKHVFIEKPITQHPSEAESLAALQKQYGVKVQVGHVERYNPAFTALDGFDLRPMFIEGHRLSGFNLRGTDVSVVLDLMIHDIDLVLSLVDAQVTSIQANGVCVVSHKPDICNARITFSNGCVANLTASRISLKAMRKLRLFQADAYVSIDFLEKNTQIVRMYDVETELDGLVIDTAKGKKKISITSPEMLDQNAIVQELRDFHTAILHDHPVKVSLTDGMKALQIAYQIDQQIQETSHDQ